MYFPIHIFGWKQGFGAIIYYRFWSINLITMKLKVKCQRGKLIYYTSDDRVPKSIEILSHAVLLDHRNQGDILSKIFNKRESLFFFSTICRIWIPGKKSNQNKIQPEVGIIHNKGKWWKRLISNIFFFSFFFLQYRLVMGTEKVIYWYGAKEKRIKKLIWIYM